MTTTTMMMMMMMIIIIIIKMNLIKAALSHCCCRTTIHSRLFHNVHYTRGNDCENRKVFSSRRNETIGEAARTRGGRDFQARAAASHRKSMIADDDKVHVGSDRGRL